MIKIVRRVAFCNADKMIPDCRGPFGSTDRDLPPETDLRALDTVGPVEPRVFQGGFPEFRGSEHFTDEDICLVNRTDYNRFNRFKLDHEKRNYKYQLKYPFWRYLEISESQSIEHGPQLK